MCGIFGYIAKRKKSLETRSINNELMYNAAKIVINGLRYLEYRGYDSWGVVIEKNGQLYIKKKIGKIGEAQVNDLPNSDFGLGHTRWATHGSVKDKNAHPHTDCSKRIALVHNGIIENYDDLKQKLINCGHKFISDTDTEVVAHLVEENLKKLPFAEAVREAFNLAKGLNAIICMDAKAKKFVAAKNGSPLVAGFSEKAYFLASDANALLLHTNNVYFLNDDELIEMDRFKVALAEVKTGKRLKLIKQKLDWKFEDAELGKFPNYMIKEIFEQPKILQNIVETTIRQLPNISKNINKAYGTYMVGCGTASYAALCGTYLFSRIALRHVNFAVGSEFGYLTHFLTRESLVIAFSQSGETMDIIESVKKAKEKGAKILAITNVLGSTLYRMADLKLLLNAGPEKCVLSTKTFIAKLAVLILLAQTLAGKEKLGRKKIKKAISEVERLITRKNLLTIQQLARKIVNKQHIYVIGRGLSYPVSLEAALKIKEVSYIHAEGFAAGELKHGVIALVDRGTPCLVFAPNDETYGAVMSGAMEVKARGGYIIGISFKDHVIFDYFIKVADCHDASSIPNIVVAQILAYYLALEKGNDPDKPRNLAKSVTVK